MHPIILQLFSFIFLALFAAGGAGLTMLSLNSNSLAASSDPLSAAVANAKYSSYSTSNPPKWAQHSEKFYQELLQEDKDGSNDKMKLGGLPSANHSENKAASENNTNHKFQIESNLKPTTSGPATNDSLQPKPTTAGKRVNTSSVSDPNKRQKPTQIEPRDKNFLLDVEILYASDTKHHMQSPSSSWQGNVHNIEELCIETTAYGYLYIMHS